MTRRMDFDSSHQQDVLTRFRVKSGRNRTQVAALIPMDHDTYRRYENGQTELRVSQVPAFAHALGIPVSVLLDALITQEVPGGWTFRDALLGRIPEDQIDELAEHWEGKPLLNQFSAAEAILQMATERRTRATEPSRKTNGC